MTQKNASARSEHASEASTRLQVRCSSIELERFQKAAEARGLTVSSWVRMVLLEEAAAK